MTNFEILKRDFNFFSYAIDSKRLTRKRRILQVSLVIIYLLLVLGTYMLLEYKINSSQAQIKSFESYFTNEEVNKKRLLAKEKKQEIRKMNQYYENLKLFNKHLQQNDVINSQYLEFVISAIPQGLTFENLSFTANTVEVQGTASNMQIIAEYLSNLEDLNLFKYVHISNISTITVDDDEESLYSFIMTCQIKDVLEE